tara:strand:- start:43 stop:570 length:528 start_codon:yes stop_codon:yes gene_type:complete
MKKLLLEILNYGDILIKENKNYVINKLYIEDEKDKKNYDVVDDTRHYLKKDSKGKYERIKIDDKKFESINIEFIENNDEFDNPIKLSNVYTKFNKLLKRKPEPKESYIEPKEKINLDNVNTLKIGDKLHTDTGVIYVIFDVNSNGGVRTDYFGSLYINKNELYKNFTHITFLKKK